MGNRFATVLQYGQEATSGTPVAATSIWPGNPPKIESDSKFEFPVENYGMRVQTRRAVKYETLYTNSISAPNAGFQQLLLPLQCGLKGLSAPVEATPGQNDYEWVFMPSLTSTLNAPKSATLEFGDNDQFWKAPYCMFDKISIKGAVAQDGGSAAVSLDASFFGRSLTQATKTPALSLKSITPMNAKLARLYMDPSFNQAGTTELANLLRDFQIDIMTGVHPDFTGSTALTFGSHKEGYLDYASTFTVESGSTAASILSAQQSGTPKAFSLVINGPQIGNGGSTHRLIVNMWGYIEKIDYAASEDRSLNLSTFGLKSALDDVSSQALYVEVDTDTSTI